MDILSSKQTPRSCAQTTLLTPITNKDSDSGSSLDSPLAHSTAAVLQEKEAGLPEAQSPIPSAAEQQVPTHQKMLLLVAYFMLNLALTISNKAVLEKARFPWLLTALHTSTTSLGCFAIMGFGRLKLTHLGSRENLIVLAFSFLFTFNIAVSNVSLAMVSIPLHQVMRSTCPAVTILIYYTVYDRTYSLQTYLSLVPLIVGAGLTTAGDYYGTVTGLLLTTLGVMLASIKTVATNRLMTGSLAMSALEVSLRMSPLAAIQCAACALVSGEFKGFSLAYIDGTLSHRFGLALLRNAVLALLLNVLSLQANKMAGALTLTVCGNVKQALTIGLGVVMFDVHVTLMNAVGLMVTVVGSLWYSKVELENRRGKMQG